MYQLRKEKEQKWISHNTDFVEKEKSQERKLNRKSSGLQYSPYWKSVQYVLDIDQKFLLTCRVSCMGNITVYAPVS